MLPKQPQLRRFLGFSGMRAFVAVLALVGYGVAPLAHEAFVDHRTPTEGFARQHSKACEHGRGGLSDASFDDGRVRASSGTSARQVETACTDCHDGHSCLAALLLQAMNAPFPDRVGHIGRGRQVQASARTGAAPIRLDHRLAPKASPPRLV